MGGRLTKVKGRPGGHRRTVRRAERGRAQVSWQSQVSGWYDALRKHDGRSSTTAQLLRQL